MLEISGLHAGYSGNEVLHGVSLKVGEGDMVAIIGPNGAGKSTLLNCISGLVRTTGGTITLEGRDITGEAAFRISRSGLLQVPEGRQILGDLTVLENLQLGVTALHDRKPTHDLRRIYALFPILEERSQQRAGSMSGGQQQMLAIARALVAAPQMILLDEPSLGLSPKLTKEIFEIVVRINRERGTTILLVEQNANMALNVADYGYVLENGRIVMEDRCAVLREKDDVKEFYLGMKEEGVRGERRWKKKKTWR